MLYIYKKKTENKKGFVFIVFMMMHDKMKETKNQILAPQVYAMYGNRKRGVDFVYLLLTSYSIGI